MTTWPTPYAEMEWQLEAHTRFGGDDVRQAGYAAGRGARWVGKFTVPAMTIANALDAQGFISSLRGGSFEMTPPGARTFSAPAQCTHSDGFGFSDGFVYADTRYATITTAAAAVQANQIQLQAWSATINIGDWLVLEEFHNTPQLVQIVDKSGTTYTVYPRLRAAARAGDSVRVYAPTISLRIVGDLPEIALRLQHSPPFIVEFEEAY